MSGRNQHYIPKQWLRGFVARRKGESEYAWTARKGGGVACPNLDGIAAQRDFYSSPASDGGPSLDEEITRYEDRLNGLVQGLRNTPLNSDADPAAAAEVIAHLTPRTAHVRDFFRQAISSLTGSARDLFLDLPVARRTLRLDSPLPDARFRKEIVARLQEDPRFRLLPIPRELFEKLAFAFVRENFDAMFDEHRPALADALSQMELSGPDEVKSAHRKALSKGLVSDARRDHLAGLNWRIHEASAGTIVLPDCVALAFGDDEACPYIMADNDNIAAVVAPVASDRFLIGLVPDATMPDLSDWNRLAAACSAQLIVADRRLPELEDLGALIGVGASRQVHAMVTKAVAGITPPPKPEAPPANPTQQSFTFNVSLPDWGDAEIGAEVSAAVQNIVTEAADHMPLDRLEGFTFAADYPTALAELDRGFEVTAPLRTVDPAVGQGFGMVPLVKRDGLVKARVIARGEIGWALIRPGDEPIRRSARAILMEFVAEASLVGELEEALPGALLSPWPDPLHLLDGAVVAGFAYIAARRSATVLREDAEVPERAGQLDFTTRHARDQIRDAGRGLRSGDNFEAFYALARGLVRLTLQAAAKLLGACHGLGQHGFTPEGELQEIVSELQLTAWLRTFEEDLDALYRRLGRWESFEEFAALGMHAERLLWAMGVMPWAQPDGEIWVQRLDVGHALAGDEA